MRLVSPREAATEPTDESQFPSRVERKLIGVRLPTQKLEQYRAFCLVHKLGFQELCELSIDAFLAGLVNQLTTINDFDDKELLPKEATGPSSNPDVVNQLTSPAKSTEERILDFYQRATGNRIREGDKQTAKRLAREPVVSVEAGIVISVLRAKNQINSLAYCEGAIREITESGASLDYSKYLLRAFESGRYKPARSAESLVKSRAAGQQEMFSEPVATLKPGG